MKREEKISMFMEAAFKSGVTKFSCLAEKDTYKLGNDKNVFFAPYDESHLEIYLSRDIEWFDFIRKGKEDHHVITISKKFGFWSKYEVRVLVKNGIEKLYPLLDSDKDLNALMKRIFKYLENRYFETRGERVGKQSGII